MKRISSKTLAGILSAVAFAGLAGAKLIDAYKAEKPVAYIYKDGQLVEKIDLAEVKEDYTVELGGNSVLVQKGKISVIKADCPDKLCVSQGIITNGKKSIICLPNKVEIRIKDASAKNIPDAVSG